MADDLSLSRIIEEIRLLVLEEAFFLDGIEFAIQRIIVQYSELSHLIEFNLTYARSNSSQLEMMKRWENKAIETAIDAKKAIEKFILLIAAQKRRGSLGKKVFFIKDHLDYNRESKKVVNFFLHTIDKFIKQQLAIFDRKYLNKSCYSDYDDDGVGREEEDIKTKLTTSETETETAEDEEEGIHVRSHFDCFAWITHYWQEKQYDQFGSPTSGHGWDLKNLKLCISSYVYNEVDDDVNYDDDIVGREEDINTIITKLTSETAGVTTSTYVICIKGDEGIGKTAVARKVYNDIHVRSHFDCFAWITHSEQIDRFTTSSFSDDILSQLTTGSPSLGQKDSATEEEDHDEIFQRVPHRSAKFIKRKLYDFLKDKRYLIVLDGFRINKDLKEFFISKTSPTSRGLEGSRVVLISNIQQDIGIGYLHNLQPLNEANSWEMFINKVSDIPFPDLESIAKQVVAKCNGVPLPILRIAKQLSDIENTYSAWFQSLISSLPLDLQRCISYLQLFPKNYEIPVRRLVALWVAEEIVMDGYLALDFLQQLIHMKIVQVTRQKVDGRPKTCSLNQIWHQHLVSKMNQQNNHQESTTTSYSSTMGIRQLPVYHSRVLSNKQLSFDSYQFLLSFLCFDYRRSYEPSRQVKDFLRRGIDKDCFLYLKVLDLEGVYKPVLPKEIERLRNLRYLGLRWTYIDELPSFIGNLFNLQTLDVKHTYINTFPKWIHKLKHLQHLYMSENHRGKFVYRRTKAAGDPPLVMLQTLWGIFIDEESHLENGLDGLINIRKLGIMYRLSIPQQQDAMAQWLLKLEELESLSLKSKDQHDKPSVLSLNNFNNHKKLSKMYLLGDLKMEHLHQHSFPPCLKKLTLSASKLHDDPMPILGMLPTLAILRLYSDSYVGLRMHCSSSSFLELKVLKMWKLEKLEEWIVDEGSMPILKELDIRSCKGLNMLPVELQQITTIQEIKLANMSETFTEKVKLDKSWSIKDNLYFADDQVDFPKKNAGTLVANGASSSSSSSSSSFSSSLGSVVLLFLLARRGGVLSTPTPTPTKHGKVPIGLSVNSSLAS